MTLVDTTPPAVWEQSERDAIVAQALQVEDPVLRARCVAPLIRAVGDESEQQGSMPSHVVDLIKELGLFWVLVPKEQGGLGGDILQAIGVTEELCTADASTGWSAMANLSVTGYYSGHCSESAVQKLFGGADLPVMAGMLAPVGRVVATDGGYLATGNYSFGSGSTHADWIAGGAKAVIDGEDSEVIFLVPRERIEFRGNWDVVGLVGTGSYDYHVPEQFVAEEFIVKRVGGVARRGQASQWLGLQIIGSAGHVGVALGIARRAIEELYAVLSVGKQRAGAAPVIEQQLFQHEFVSVEARLAAARSFCNDTFGSALDTVAAGNPYTELQYQRVRQATTLVTRAAADAVEFAYTWSGSKGLRRGAISRCMRDMHAATQHMYVDASTMVNAAPTILRSYQRED